MKRMIPNTITLINLFSGCMALICIFTNALELVPFFIAIGLLSDYTDGLAARLLKVSSELGKELDSLADMVSFGVVPGAMLFYMINETLGIDQIDFYRPSTFWGVIGFLVTLFACLRLAKFNLDTRQTEGFVGLNTPACTIFVLGLLIIVLKDTYGLRHFVLQAPFLYGLSFVLAYLLVAEIPMFSFKFKSLKWKGNRVRFLFILLTLVWIIAFPLGLALTLVTSSYVLLSVVLWLFGILKKEGIEGEEDIVEGEEY
ncbi:MAG: CDP-diacylglycerol--serine O-phosphatidyltransferase [Aureispira sp.]|nr:CDP-diacylglycerol--serine O-phosphatidyltransferase [Aureispira sp.]